MIRFHALKPRRQNVPPTNHGTLRTPSVGQKPTLPEFTTPREYTPLLVTHPHLQPILRRPKTIYNFLSPRATLRHTLLSAIKRSEEEYADRANSFESSDYTRGFPSHEEHIELLLDSGISGNGSSQTLLLMIAGERTGEEPVGYAVANCSVKDASKYVDVTFELKMLYVIPAYRSQGFGSLLVYLLQILVASVYDRIKVQSNFPGISDFLTGTLQGQLYNDQSLSIYKHLSETIREIVPSENFTLDTYSGHTGEFKKVAHG